MLLEGSWNRGLGASTVDRAASRGKCSRTPSLYTTSFLLDPCSEGDKNNFDRMPFLKEYQMICFSLMLGWIYLIYDTAINTIKQMINKRPKGHNAHLS